MRPAIDPPSSFNPPLSDPSISIALNGNTAARVMQGVPKEITERRLPISCMPKGSLETDD